MQDDVSQLVKQLPNRSFPYANVTLLVAWFEGKRGILEAREGKCNKQFCTLYAREVTRTEYMQIN